MSQETLGEGQGEGNDTGGPSDPKPKPEGHWGWAILNLSVLALLGWGLFSMASCTWKTGNRMATNIAREMDEQQEMLAEADRRDRAREAARQGEVSDAVIEAGARSAIIARAVDPGSVRFRNVEVYRQSTGSKAVCGEFNARNRMGGYGGFERFVSAGVEQFTWVETEVDGFNQAWATHCKSGS